MRLSRITKNEFRHQQQAGWSACEQCARGWSIQKQPKANAPSKRARANMYSIRPRLCIVHYRPQTSYPAQVHLGGLVPAHPVLARGCSASLFLSSLTRAPNSLPHSSAAEPQTRARPQTTGLLPQTGLPSTSATPQICQKSPPLLVDGEHLLLDFVQFSSVQLQFSANAPALAPTPDTSEN